MERVLNSVDTASAQKATSDVEVFGSPDIWQLLCKASSKSQGWMKSTKAMQVSGGCVLQVTTQQGGIASEALTFVPQATIQNDTNADGQVIGRRLV